MPQKQKKQNMQRVLMMAHITPGAQSELAGLLVLKKGETEFGGQITIASSGSGASSSATSGLETAYDSYIASKILVGVQRHFSQTTAGGLGIQFVTTGSQSSTASTGSKTTTNAYSKTGLNLSIDYSFTPATNLGISYIYVPSFSHDLVSSGTNISYNVQHLSSLTARLGWFF